MAKKQKQELVVANFDHLNNIDIKALIHEIRGQQVLLDRDLAMLYGVETRTLNQAVKRNKERFPLDFMFQLNTVEWNSLKSQIATSKQTENQEILLDHQQNPV